jgi:predicted nicotinamide N-methyase
MNPSTVRLTASARLETNAHGVTLLHGNHKKIRPLKKKYKPTGHGHKVWPSSWLLIDYLKKTKLVAGKRVMDLGCGWGLTGIYCAKQHRALVTCVDIDDAVEPYVTVMAETNKVQVQYINRGIDQIHRDLLKEVDVIVASDICFTESLIDPLRRLIHRAQKASVKQILISDPGRGPFRDLCDLFVRKKGVEVIDWHIQKPAKVAGEILSIQWGSPK